MDNKNRRFDDIVRYVQPRPQGAFPYLRRSPFYLLPVTCGNGGPSLQLDTAFPLPTLITRLVFTSFLCCYTSACFTLPCITLFTLKVTLHTRFREILNRRNADAFGRSSLFPIRRTVPKQTTPIALATV